jgi:nucleotide-binding universal stress UspA family protein
MTTTQPRIDPIDQLDALTESLARGESVAPAPAPFPLLLALADDRAAEAAVDVTHALARERHAQPTVLHVLELGMYALSEVLPSAPAVAEAILGPEFRERCRAELRAKHPRNGGIASDWPLEVALGDAASSIVQRARASAAALIVMGLNAHGIVGRAFGNDTAHEVIAAGIAPVLAVRPELTGLPERIVVATDFSEASLRAARLAARIAAPRATMFLAHVMEHPVTGRTEHDEAEEAVWHSGIDDAFARAYERIQPPAGVTLEGVPLHGRPVIEIEALADRIGADLVTVGRQQHGRAERLLIGSVATALLHHGRRSMLITPPPTVRA